MQVIDEFEPDHGAYCGAIGYSSRCGRLALDVSIRTIELRPLSGGNAGRRHTNSTTEPVAESWRRAAGIGGRELPRPPSSPDSSPIDAIH